MSADEYLAIGEIPERTELVHGVVVMSPSPNLRHQKIVRRLLQQLTAFEDENPGVEVFQDTDVRFDDRLVYQPDVAVYRPGRVAPDATQLDVSPDLVIEVLSPGSKALDLVTKRGDYERGGVAEYWVLDPADASVRVWRREGGRLVESACGGDQVPSSAVPGFALDLRPIRRIVRGG